MAIRLKDRIEANIRQSDKVNSSLSIQLNNGIATVYDGSSSKNINITPAAINSYLNLYHGDTIIGQYNCAEDTHWSLNYPYAGFITNEYRDNLSTYLSYPDYLDYHLRESDGHVIIGSEWGKNSDNQNFGVQFRIDGWTGTGYIRAFNGWNENWTDWKTLLDSNNFNNFTPTLYGNGATGDWNIHIKGYSRGITNDFNHTLVIAKNLGALISAYCDGIINWAMERRSPEKQMSVHYYDTTNGDWLEEHILLDHINYSGYALPLTGGTMTGPINFANNTWNAIGDDCYFGDRNIAGTTCFKAMNSSETSLVLFNTEETAKAQIRLDTYNNLIFHADGGIVYSLSELGIAQGHSIYFDSTTVSSGAKWYYASSGGHQFHFISAPNDGSDAANGYWVDMQCHGSSTCPSSVYVTRWINGVEQGRICLLDQYNNTWKTGGTLYLQNGGGLVLERMYNGVAARGIYMYSDVEGGQFEIYNYNNTAVFCMDAPYDRRLRIYHWDITNNSYCGEITIGDGTVTGAVWNDYAEFRDQNEPLIAGYITYCDDDGKLKYTTERLQKFEGVVSDTFGFAIGETDECKTPLAVSGRALVYCDPEDHFHSGDCICAGPNGKAYRMTREEIAMYPDRIVGVVSEIPIYERWGTGNVKVDGRIWIKVR